MVTIVMVILHQDSITDLAIVRSTSVTSADSNAPFSNNDTYLGTCPIKVLFRDKCAGEVWDQIKEAPGQNMKRAYFYPPTTRVAVISAME